MVYFSVTGPNYLCDSVVPTNYTKPLKTLSGVNEELLGVKIGGKYRMFPLSCKKLKQLLDGAEWLIPAPVEKETRLGLVNS